VRGKAAGRRVPAGGGGGDTAEGGGRGRAAGGGAGAAGGGARGAGAGAGARRRAAAPAREDPRQAAPARGGGARADPRGPRAPLRRKAGAAPGGGRARGRRRRRHRFLVLLGAFLHHFYSPRSTPSQSSVLLAPAVIDSFAVCDRTVANHMYSFRFIICRVKSRLNCACRIRIFQQLVDAA
jgi:hypothetical protein